MLILGASASWSLIILAGVWGLLPDLAGGGLGLCHHEGLAARVVSDVKVGGPILVQRE